MARVVGGRATHGKTRKAWRAHRSHLLLHLRMHLRTRGRVLSLRLVQRAARRRLLFMNPAAAAAAAVSHESILVLGAFCRPRLFLLAQLRAQRSGLRCGALRGCRGGVFVLLQPLQQLRTARFCLRLEQAWAKGAIERGRERGKGTVP